MYIYYKHHACYYSFIIYMYYKFNTCMILTGVNLRQRIDQQQSYKNLKKGNNRLRVNLCTRCKCLYLYINVYCNIICGDYNRIYCKHSVRIIFPQNIWYLFNFFFRFFCKVVGDPGPPGGT